MTRKLSRISICHLCAILGMSIVLLVCQWAWLSTVALAHDCETDWTRAED